MICADLVRPTVGWLAASSISTWALARNREASRDPGGFGRAACETDRHVTPSVRQATVGRAAILVAAKGGVLDDVAAGDFLELLDIETQIDRRPRDYSAASWRLLHALGTFGPGAPAALAELRSIGQRSSPQPSTATGWPAAQSAICWSPTCRSGSPRWTTTAWTRSPSSWACCSGRTSNATTGASTR